MTLAIFLSANLICWSINRVHLGLILLFDRRRVVPPLGGRWVLPAVDQPHAWSWPRETSGTSEGCEFNTQRRREGQTPQTRQANATFWSWLWWQIFYMPLGTSWFYYYWVGLLLLRPVQGSLMVGDEPRGADTAKWSFLTDCHVQLLIFFF